MVWRSQRCMPIVGAKTAPTCTGLQTTAVHGVQNRAENGNWREFVCTYRHGTVFTLKKCQHQKEANGMMSSKVYSTR